MSRRRTKTELIQLFRDIGKNKPISFGMMRELIDLVWPKTNRNSTPGRITELTSHNIEIIFPQPFISQPATILFAVYRYRQRGNAYIKTNVLYSYPDENQPTTTGFEINIDQTENLTGIIIEYEFIEI